MFLIRDGERIRIWTPAKVNLFLELLGRRDDGYHELETLMVPINLYDTLSAARDTRGQIAISCRWADGFYIQQQIGTAGLGDLPGDHQNIVVRAVERLRARAGVSCGLRLNLVKRIPIQAGLGGASSDAAAALLAANEAWQLRWPRPRLAEVAAEIGSDVPFFLNSVSAVCRGRGELVEAITMASPLHLVIARPPAGLSTPEVYRQAHVPRRPRSVSATLAALRTGGVQMLAGQLFNRLGAAAEQLSPWLGRIRKVFQGLDVVDHAMSGSGTTYFGLCHHRRHARRVAGMLRAARLGTIMVVTTLCPRAAG